MNLEIYKRTLTGGVQQLIVYKFLSAVCYPIGYRFGINSRSSLSRVKSRLCFLSGSKGLFDRQPGSSETMDPQRIADQINMAPNEIAKKFNIDPSQAEPVLKTTRDWVMMVGAALYVLSPLDLIPEAVFGVFGFLDDALVLLMAGIWYFRKYQATQESNKKRWTNKFTR